MKIAQAYNVSPVAALVDTEYLDPKWAETVSAEVALRTVTEDQLADEVLRRMKIGIETDVFLTPVDELAARHDVRPAFYDDGTVEEWDSSEPYAADSSPDETEERLERGEDPID